jgi:hypothetical protein
MCIQNIYVYNCGHSYEFLVLHPSATEPCEAVPEVAVPVGRDCKCCEEAGYCPECHRAALVGGDVSERRVGYDTVELDGEECEGRCCLAGPSSCEPNSNPGHQVSPALCAPSLVDFEAHERQEHDKKPFVKYQATNQLPTNYKTISHAELEQSLQENVDKQEETQDDATCHCAQCAEYEQWAQAKSLGSYEETVQRRGLLERPQQLMREESEEYCHCYDSTEISDSESFSRLSAVPTIISPERERHMVEILHRFELTDDIRAAAIVTHGPELDELNALIEDIANGEARSMIEKERVKWARECADWDREVAEREREEIHRNRDDYLEEFSSRITQPRDRERRRERCDQTPRYYHGVAAEPECAAASASRKCPPISQNLYNELLDADDEVEQLERNLREIEQRLEEADLRREAKYNMVRSRQDREGDDLKRRDSEARKKNKGKERKK